MLHLHLMLCLSDSIVILQPSMSRCNDCPHRLGMLGNIHRAIPHPRVAMPHHCALIDILQKFAFGANLFLAEKAGVRKHDPAAVRSNMRQ